MLKLPKHRRFEYIPRYSSPDAKDRIKFQRKTCHHPRSGRGLMFYLILAVAFFLIYLYISRGISLKKPAPVQLSPENAVQTPETNSP